jgi:hypothetical protein
MPRCVFPQEQTFGESTLDSIIKPTITCQLSVLYHPDMQLPCVWCRIKVYCDTAAPTGHTALSIFGPCRFREGKVVVKTYKQRNTQPEFLLNISVSFQRATLSLRAASIDT